MPCAQLVIRANINVLSVLHPNDGDQCFHELNVIFSPQ